MDASFNLSTSEIIRRQVLLRNPFMVETLPWLSRLHSAAFKPRRRLSKRFIGKPAKRLFRLLMGLGAKGTGHFSLILPDGPRLVEFNARNTQFGALYQPQCQPLYGSSLFQVGSLSSSRPAIR